MTLDQTARIGLGARLAQLLFVILLGTVVYIGTCSRPALFDEPDATNAEAGYQMLRNGDWVTPYSNYVPRLNKPPMVYWLIASSYTLLGVSEFSARLPFGLATIGVILVTFGIGNVFSGGRAGFYSAIAAATSAGIFVFTRTIIGDIVFVLFLSLGFYMFLKAYMKIKEGGAGALSTLMMLGFYANLGLAVMSKGLIGLVLPIMIIGLFLVISRDIGFIWRMRLLTGTMMFLAIAAPWHIAADMANPGFLRNYICDEHALRFLGHHYPKDFESIPVWEFWLVNFAGLFPWVFFLPSAKRYWPRSIRTFDRDERLLLFLTLWASVVLVFFSFSARLEHYGLPAYPACAAIVGMVIARAEERGKLPELSGAALGMLFVGVTAGTLTAMFLSSISHLGQSRLAVMSNSKMAFFSVMNGLSAAAFDALWPEVAAAAAAALFIGVLSNVAIRGRTAAVMAVGIAVGMMGIFGAIQSALQRFEPILSQKILAERINREWRTRDVVVIEGDFFNTSSIGFYTHKRVYRWRGHPKWEFGSRFHNGRRMYLNDEQMERLWDSTHRVYLVADVDTLKKAGFFHGAILMAANGSELLITNMPNVQVSVQ